MPKRATKKSVKKKVKKKEGPIPCNCVELTRKALEKKFGKESDVQLDISFGLDLSTGKCITDFNGIKYTRRTMKRDGTYTKGRKTFYLRFNYCPVCGKKYNYGEKS